MCLAGSTFRTCYRYARRTFLPDVGCHSSHTTPQSNEPSAFTCRPPDKTFPTHLPSVRLLAPPLPGRLLCCWLSLPGRRYSLLPAPLALMPILAPVRISRPPFPSPLLLKDPECRNICCLFGSCCTHDPGLLQQGLRDQSRPQRVETPVVWTPEILDFLWKCCVDGAVAGRGNGGSLVGSAADPSTTTAAASGGAIVTYAVPLFGIMSLVSDEGGTSTFGTNIQPAVSFCFFGDAGRAVTVRRACPFDLRWRAVHPQRMSVGTQPCMHARSGKMSLSPNPLRASPHVRKESA